MLCARGTFREANGIRCVLVCYAAIRASVLPHSFGTRKNYPHNSSSQLVQFYTVLGKAEGQSTDHHGHVTALTVAPEYRRLSLARKMMSLLERVSDETYHGFFVDLYVRCANGVAIGMYEGSGYSVYRRVREYYGNLGMGASGKDEEDAFGEFLFLFLF